MGGRWRVLLVFVCLATSVASVVAPGQQPHRPELAGAALLAALLLLRRRQHQSAAKSENTEAGPEQEAVAAPARRRFQTRRSHARELALATIQRTLAEQGQHLVDLGRTQTALELAANERLCELVERLAELESRTNTQQQALRESHTQHADQLSRLHRALTHHTQALHHLERTLDTSAPLRDEDCSPLDLAPTR